MQNWSLERKIQVTQTRIIEWYQHWEGKVYVSFSGGKDSTVLLDLARRIYPDIEAVFLDTGLEYPEIREFVKTKENVTWLYPIKYDKEKKEWIKTNFKDVIDIYGYPVISKIVSQRIEGARRGQKSAIELLNGTYTTNGKDKSIFNCEKYKYLTDAPFKISDKCCKVMKKDPTKLYEREKNLKAIIGTMACEGRQRESSWLKTGCNAFNSQRPSSQPMSFWTEQDVLRYIKQFNIPYASVYGDIVSVNNGSKTNPQMILKTTNLERTGCMFCMFGCHLDKEPNRFQRMKITHPKQYNYCIRPIEENGLGLGKVLDYIGVKYE